MQTPNQRILAAQEMFMSWAPHCQLCIKKQDPSKAPDPYPISQGPTLIRCCPLPLPSCWMLSFPSAYLPPIFLG